MTAVSATDQAKLLRAWSDNAIAQMGSVRDIAAWVVLHRYRLHDLEQAAPDKRRELQLAISARWMELDR